MAKETQEVSIAGIGLDAKSSIPMYRQLYEALRQAILQGRFRSGQRLPATRTLASELDVSRNTVLLAFEYLLSEGYLKGKTGSGTYVTDTLPEKLLFAARSTTDTMPSRPKRQNLSKRGEVLSTIHFPVGESKPLRHGTPSLRDFPFHIWGKLLARQMRRLPYTSFGYGDAAGYLPLREAIATYLRTARDVRCEVEQIIIVNGSQQALDLTARVLLDPGDKAWIEDPGYLGARKAFIGASVTVTPVPIDEEGLNVEKGREIESKARLAYVTPSHQFPLGVTMSLTRRLQLLEWADESDAWILEDDYDSEYRYTGRPLSSLQGLDANGCVIYMGTFSKVLFPALRLGYLIVPPDLLDAFISAKAVTDRNSALLEQAVLADFIEQGHFGRHLRRMRLLYQERQQILLNATTRHLKGLIEIYPSAKGMHEIAWLPNDFDDQKVSHEAAEAGLAVTALSTYCLKHSSHPGLVLGYAAFTEDEIRQAVTRLAGTLIS